MSKDSWKYGHLQADDIKSNIADFCDKVDDLICSGELSPYSGEGKWRIVISGSACFLLFGISNRFRTDDIDICDYNTSKEINNLLAEFDMNTEVTKFGMTLPAKFTSRLATIHEGNYITACSPSWEDLAFSKIGTNREQDDMDLDGLVKSGKLDWDILDAIMHDESETTAAGMPQGQFDKIFHNYNVFLERHDRKAEWGVADPFDGWDD